MRGFILAAGFGTRLKPLTDYLPKALISVAGKPLLSHALEFMRRNGIHDIGVNAHYFTDQICSYKDANNEVFEIFEEKQKIRGTGGALEAASAYLKGTDCFFVANVDIVTTINIKRIADEFIASDDICRLVTLKNTSGNGSIIFDDDNGIYSGTPGDTNGSNQQGQVTGDFTGLAFYRRDFLDFLTDSDFSIVPVWKRAARLGAPIRVHLVDGVYWIDAGNPSSLAQVHFDSIDGISGINPPDDLVIDREKRCCYPLGSDIDTYSDLGIHCWIENPDFIPKQGYSHIVVYKHSPVVTGWRNSNILLTRWGEIHFNG